MSLPANRSKVIGDGLIKPWEEVWVVHQPYLLDRGYRLPERYNPNWVPSWTKISPRHEKRPPALYPDSAGVLGSPSKSLLDAVRLSDKKRVVLKAVHVEKDIPILDYLNSPLLLSDKRNHTVPILDRIPIPGEEDRVWVVMPMLQLFDTYAHPFQYVSEIIEAFSQFLEGLEFMHENGVAHRDACFFNLMVETTKLVPDGNISFYAPTKTLDWSRRIRPKERRLVAPLEYFYIDFEFAIRFSPGERNPLCVGIFGQERGVPELSETVPYNPCKLDVYQLGSVFRPLFEEYDGMEFFEPLYKAMTCADPDTRPTAAEANMLFKGLVSSFTEKDMSRRIWDKKTPLATRHKIESSKFRRLRHKLSRLLHLTYRY